MRHAHYLKEISHLKTLDVYRVCQLFDVTDPAIQHAVKKLLCAGQRGAKNNEQDYREAIDSISRALQMIAEDDSEAKPARAEELQADESQAALKYAMEFNELPKPDNAELMEALGKHSESVSALTGEVAAIRESLKRTEKLLSGNVAVELVGADDGWIEWGGGDRPVDVDALVEVKFHTEQIGKNRAGNFDWKHGCVCLKIIAYRVVTA